jgi:hypothetical protein
MEAPLLVDPYPYPRIDAPPLMDPSAHPGIDDPPLMDPSAHPGIDASPLMDPSAHPGIDAPPLMDPSAYHSSVLRVASDETQLWAHFDTMDNALAQVTGCEKSRGKRRTKEKRNERIGNGIASKEQGKKGVVACFCGTVIHIRAGGHTLEGGVSVNAFRSSN